ncbi:undecaprenyl-diphosphate phosphatase [Actinoallomurus soli]|uniref:undecaprenyl-diphosphate phosphatase n=1 Tax=Actinoallomurus soli TaxID=2952535 RepID=UPI0020930CE8|nr:undecaprenyl-diphosphate phosphatase [Actinoallomurus soli]MCO5969911.1 undecaprenyl-diphosphate phosphatase [Actinoallomurus soli]
MSLSYPEAIVIGALQGVAELFPVSSLGHSILIPALIGGRWASDLSVTADKSPYLAFVVGLHVATALALVLFFWRDWVRIIGGLFSSIRNRRIQSPSERLAWLLIAATIPVGVAGVALDHLFRTMLGKPTPVAVFLALNGLVIFAGERLRKKGGSTEHVRQHGNVSVTETVPDLQLYGLNMGQQHLRQPNPQQPHQPAGHPPYAGGGSYPAQQPYSGQHRLAPDWQPQSGYERQGAPYAQQPHAQPRQGGQPDPQGRYRSATPYEPAVAASVDHADADANQASDERIAGLGFLSGILIGAAQILALAPGISRSGVTMIAGLAKGLSHEDAARFAFLLATPAILGAGVLKLPELFGPMGNGIHGQILVGSLLSFVGAYVSVRFLTKYFETRTLTPFAIYCTLFGIGSLVYLNI